jgi:hypothetical protein
MTRRKIEDVFTWKIAVVYKSGNKFMEEVARELARTFSVERVIITGGLDPLPVQPPGIKFAVTADRALDERVGNQWSGGIPHGNADEYAIEFDSLPRQIRGLTTDLTEAGASWRIVNYGLDDHVQSGDLTRLLQAAGFTLIGLADLPELPVDYVLLLDHHAREHEEAKQATEPYFNICICPCCFGQGTPEMKPTESLVTYAAGQLRNKICAI